MEMFLLLLSSACTAPRPFMPMGSGLSSASTQGLCRQMGERSPFLARQCSWFSWLSLLVISRVEVCLWFVKLLFEMLNRKSFSWVCPLQCFMVLVSTIFFGWYCQWDMTRVTEAKLTEASAATYALFLSSFSYHSGNAVLDEAKW